MANKDKYKNLHTEANSLIEYLDKYNRTEIISGIEDVTLPDGRIVRVQLVVTTNINVSHVVSDMYPSVFEQLEKMDDE